MTILGNTTIGEGSIIQAGSVVVNNIPPLSIAGGGIPPLYFQKEMKNTTISVKKWVK